ncbi:RHS repeat domain-containing protein [Xanthomonas medicagonis]|uniref:RHS repeat domain-containing protein n=1 Tax=Xanthomonas medicagonis TaxID=3160841 RepID=UPI0035174CF3
MPKLKGICAAMRYVAVAAFSLFVVFGASAQTIRYIHTDGLGSVVLETDKNRNALERSEYEPYGSLLSSSIKDGPGYTGHVKDVSTGLNYMQQRYYDSSIGSFLSADPISVNGYSGSNFNRYAYANNSPYRFVDLDGRISTECGLCARYIPPEERFGVSKIAGAGKQNTDKPVTLMAEIVVRPYQEADGSGGMERRFGLTSPSLSDGWIVQKIRADLIGRDNGIVVKNQYQQYWEAFRIYKGQQHSVENDKFYVPSPLGVSPQGSITLKATARYYEGLILPGSFTRGGAREAGKLYSTYNDPNLDASNASNVVEYNFRLDWP